MCPITLLLVAKKAHKCCRLCPRGHLTKLTYNPLLPDILCGTRQSINKLLAYWGVSSHTDSSGVGCALLLVFIPYLSHCSLISAAAGKQASWAPQRLYFFQRLFITIYYLLLFFRDWSSLLALVSSSKSLSLFPSLLSSARLCSLLLSASWGCFILQLPSSSCSYIFIDSLALLPSDQSLI